MNETLEAAMALYCNRAYEDALAVVESTASLDEKERRYLRGLCYIRLRRWEDALVDLEQVVTSDSDFSRIFQCRLALALAYVHSGRMKLAEYELETLLDSGFESAQVFSAFAYLLVAKGDSSTAAEYYKKALDIDPENTTALNGLAYACAVSGIELKKALLSVKKALEKKPDYPAYLDTLAWVYHKLGLSRDARDIIDRALKRAGGEPTILSHARAIAEA
jgi:Tfp pilus assembly protein PilF